MSTFVQPELRFCCKHTRTKNQPLRGKLPGQDERLLLWAPGAGAHQYEPIKPTNMNPKQQQMQHHPPPPSHPIPPHQPPPHTQPPRRCVSRPTPRRGGAARRGRCRGRSAPGHWAPTSTADGRLHLCRLWVWGVGGWVGVGWGGAWGPGWNVGRGAWIP